MNDPQKETKIVTLVKCGGLNGGLYKLMNFFKWSLLSIPASSLYAVTAVSLSWIIIYVMNIFYGSMFLINEYVIAFFLILSCIIVAVFFGFLSGLIASLISFFSINYVFVSPYPQNIFSVNNFSELLTAGNFLSVALLFSLSASKIRDYLQNKKQHEKGLKALFALHNASVDSFSSEQVIEKLHSKLEKMLGVQMAFFLPQGKDSSEISRIFPYNLNMNSRELLALNSFWKGQKAENILHSLKNDTKWYFELMASPSGKIQKIGVLGVKTYDGSPIDSWLKQLLKAVAEQMAAILEHIETSNVIVNERILREKERIHSNILLSFSHDFKTPLAGIIGAIGVHRSMGNSLEEKKREELLDSAVEEAHRLDSFITNILDITNLENGGIKLKKEWYLIQDIIDSAISSSQYFLRNHRPVVYPCPLGLEVNVDVAMIKKVIQNILDNACKYTPPDTAIDISCSVSDNKWVIIKIRDYGIGIDENRLQNIFDKYTRLEKTDSQIAGTGLGLAVSNEIIKAHNGWIKAENVPYSGALFTICLPECRISMPKLSCS